MIELNQVSKRYGSVMAVHEISLHIPAGQFFALLGPNAAGKTTTLKILCGLLSPDSGTARLCGCDVRAEPTKARQFLAFVPDYPFLYDKLTPLEFLRFTGKVFRLPAATLDASIANLVERFHLVEQLHKTIDSLSHGTRQRVALAAALVHDPRVIVIDEPMVGLDPQHARVVKDVLKERVQAGAAVLLSTHQLPMAEEVADRIGIMHQGRLVAVGTREELTRLGGQDGRLESAFLALTQLTKEP